MRDIHLDDAHYMRVARCRQIEDWFYAKSGLPRTTITYHMGVNPNQRTAAVFHTNTQTIDIWTCEETRSRRFCFTGVLEELFHYWQCKTYCEELMISMSDKHEAEVLKELLRKPGDDLPTKEEFEYAKATAYDTNPIEVEAKSFAESAYEQILTEEGYYSFSTEYNAKPPSLNTATLQL